MKHGGITICMIVMIVSDVGNAYLASKGASIITWHHMQV